MALKAAILDWAGTVVDHGSRAPMGAFVRAFAKFDVAIAVSDARGPMGLPKREHIRMVGQAPAVAAAWRARHGRAFSETDIDAIFAVFEPMNISAIRDHAGLIPGALDSLAMLQKRGIRIGSTTGYTRAIMAELLPLAKLAGYEPEITVCAGDLPEGRPSPLMMWHAMAHMGVWPAHDVVKVDDTYPGIGEGLAAGTWTVGIALTGNVSGMSAEELAGLNAGEKSALREKARKELTGAHILIDGTADLPAAIDEIASRIARGEMPARTAG